MCHYSPARDAPAVPHSTPDGGREQRFLYQNDPSLRARGVGSSPDSARIAFTVVPWHPGQETRPDLRVFTADSNGQGASLVARDRWERGDVVFSPREGRLGIVASGHDVLGPASIRLIESGTSREIAPRTYSITGGAVEFLVAERACNCLYHIRSTQPGGEWTRCPEPRRWVSAPLPRRSTRGVSRLAPGSASLLVRRFRTTEVALQTLIGKASQLSPKSGQLQVFKLGFDRIDLDFAVVASVTSPQLHHVVAHPPHMSAS